MTVAFEVAGRTRHAALWLPPDFDPRRRWPLLVFLHAYEERGDDMEHLSVGIGPALEECPSLYPCIVLQPQCPRDLVWSVVDRPWAAGCSSAEDHVTAAIAAVVDRYPVDPEAVGLTGASMGGYGTFGYGSRHAERFRVLAPLCGGGTIEDAAALAGSSLIVVHGTDDAVVPIEESRRMVRAIEASASRLPAERRGMVRLWEIAGRGHAVWELVYRDPGFARFLVSGDQDVEGVPPSSAG